MTWEAEDEVDEYFRRSFEATDYFQDCWTGFRKRKLVHRFICSRMTVQWVNTYSHNSILRDKRQGMKLSYRLKWYVRSISELCKRLMEFRKGTSCVKLASCRREGGANVAACSLVTDSDQGDSDGRLTGDGRTNAFLHLHFDSCCG